MISQENARTAKLVMMVIIIVMLYMMMIAMRSTAKDIAELNAKMKLPFNIGGTSGK